MEIRIRNERYYADGSSRIFVSHHGKNTHVMVFCNYWQRILVMDYEAEAVADRIRKSLDRGCEVCDLNRTRGLSLKIPKIKAGNGIEDRED